MTETPIQPDDAAAAIRALLSPLADVAQAAADLCASAHILTQTDELAALCRDAAALCDAVALIQRRTQP